MRYVLLAMTLTSLIAATPPAAGQTIREITYLSRADKTLQPAMFYAPVTEQRVPLIVALHTWSGDYRQRGHQRIAEWCLTNGWAFLHPNFRGPNDKPEATGSQLVVDDIVSGVVVNLNGDSVTLNTDLTDPNQRTNVDRKLVKSMEVSKVSPMPPMLLAMLTKDEILDLVAYVLSGGNPEDDRFAK